MNKRTVSPVAIIGTALVFAACGSGKNARPSSSSENTFGLGEFSIIPPTNTLHAGRVTITADNLGGEVHELVIVRRERRRACEEGGRLGRRRQDRRCRQGR